MTSFVIAKQNRKAKIVDVAIPSDVRVSEKGIEKINKYKSLKDEIISLWEMLKVNVIRIIVEVQSDNDSAGEIYIEYRK